jgi:hypothetical protein
MEIMRHYTTLFMYSRRNISVFESYFAHDNLLISL